jgi:phage-related protein
MSDINNTSSNNSAKNDIVAATDKIKNFCEEKLQDANHYVEKETKKFEISSSGNDMNRIAAAPQQWFDKTKNDLENLTEEKKKEFDKATSGITEEFEKATKGIGKEFDKATAGITGGGGSTTKSTATNENENENENKNKNGTSVGDEEFEGCADMSIEDLNCNSCGLFST